MRVAVYGDQKLYQELLKALRALGEDEPIGHFDTLTSEEKAAVEVIFGWEIPQRAVDACPRLRWIQGAGAGVDWILPVHLPDEVVVTRIVDQFGPDMGEFALLSVLAWVKNYRRILAQQAEHQWRPYLVGQLAGLTVGVLGAGSIGAHIARLFQPMCAEVRALGRRKPEIPGVKGYQSYEHDRFYEGLDVLVMVLPHTPDTEHLVGEAAFRRMNPGGYVVNLGRGAVLDEEALVRAITAGTLSGAALDVLETEPLPPDSPLWDLPGVTISPHISGPSRRTGMAAVFSDNLHRYRQGRPLLGQVDLERGY